MKDRIRSEFGDQISRERAKFSKQYARARLRAQGDKEKSFKEFVASKPLDNFQRVDGGTSRVDSRVTKNWFGDNILSSKEKVFDVKDGTATLSERTTRSVIRPKNIRERMDAYLDTKPLGKETKEIRDKVYDKANELKNVSEDKWHTAIGKGARSQVLEDVGFLTDVARGIYYVSAKDT